MIPPPLPGEPVLLALLAEPAADLLLALHPSDPLGTGGDVRAFPPRATPVNVVGVPAHVAPHHANILI